MNEGDVKDWFLTTQNVSRETLDRIGSFVALLLEESLQQDLISCATIADGWDRHIRDAAQLLALTLPEQQSGRVLALLGSMEMTLVETRARAAWRFSKRSAMRWV